MSERLIWYFTGIDIVSEDHENTRKRIHALTDQGNQLICAGRFQEATEYLSQAQSLASSNRFAAEELQALISLSACAVYAGDKVLGQSFIERSLKLARDLGDGLAQGKCLLNLGGIHINSEPERAIEYYREALIVYDSVGNFLGIAQSLDNIGMAYNGLGALRSATNYIDRALKAFKKANEPIELAKCLVAAGNLMTDMANEGLEEPTLIRPIAKKHYEKAFRIFQELRSPVYAAKCLDMLGLLSKDEGKPDDAITLHQRAVEIFQRFGNLSLHSSALLHLGSAHVAKKNYEAALQAYAFARQLKEKLHDLVGYANVCHCEGVVMNTCGHYADASGSLKFAVQIKDELVEKVTDEQSRAHFAAQCYKSWSEYLYALSKRCEAEGGEQGVSCLAMELEEGKARLLRRHIAEVSPTAWQENHESLQHLQQEIELRTRISSSGIKRMDLRKKLENKLITPEQFDKQIQRVISSHQTAFFQLQEMRQGTSRAPTSELTTIRPEDMLSEIGRELPSPIEPTLVFMLDFTSRNAIGFGVIRDKNMSFKTVEIDSDELTTLFAWVERLRSIKPDNLGSWEIELCELSCRLGDLLHRGEVLKGLKEERSLIILIPHGNWHHFPWEIAACAGGYLGTQFAVVRNYSATLLNSLRDKTRDKATRESRPLAQVYCPHPESLPGSEAEAIRVMNVLRDGAFEVVSFVKQQATREKFIEEAREGDFCLLHFAGHSAYDCVDPLLSALMLRSNQDLPGDDGRTTALEIERRVRFRGAPLVYLSSCESAVVQMQQGDEAFGLVRALLLAGASSLILSNWLVLDSSAPDMATAFYETLLGGSNPAEALRRARREVSQKAHDGKYPQTGDLIHWGPFCVYGDPLAGIR